MNTNYKNAFYAVSLILIFAISIGMAFAPTASAQIGIPQPEKTAGYISVAPALLGVDQKATVNLWVLPIPTDYLYGPADNGFYGITVTFVKPDGTTDSFKPVDGTGQYVAGEAESTGSLYFTYAPDEAGNWSVSFTMPAQNVTDYSGTVQYTACTSSTAYFTVQTSAVNAGLLDGYPWAQLPNSNVYWSYPINSNNREWSAISGNWLQTSSYVQNNVFGVTCRLYQPYGSGPSTAHIVWSVPLQPGGIIGGAYGSLSYTSAISFRSATIIDGNVFVNIPEVNEFECISLTTGQVLYTASGQFSCGVTLPGNAFAQSFLSFLPGQKTVILPSSYGSSPTAYLFSGGSIINELTGAPSTWNYYNPSTGALMITIDNVTTNFYNLVDGTNLAYGVLTNGQVFGWNMSNVIANNMLTAYEIGVVSTGNWQNGLMWTTSISPDITGSASLNAPPELLGISSDLSTIVIHDPNQYWGFNAATGASVWNLTLNYPVAENEEISLYGVNDFIIWNPTAATFNCYSELTGTLLWTSPSFSSSPWATTWTVYYSETNDQNNFYAMFPDGTIAAMSLATGKLVWHNTAIPSTEYTANAVPYVSGMVMEGGNIYAYAGYSIFYQINPIPRFAMLVCVNATTGDVSYTLNGGLWPVAAADGYVVCEGINDGKLYCIGKGQTSTTVTAQQQVGGSVLVQGSVLDQSAGQPNTPAISDSDMSVWMDYTHMQNSTLLNAPPDCTGVPVTLTAVSSTGTTVNLGTVTSDGDGHFAYQWTPTTPGLYTVYATFAGTDSYFSSYTETSATVAITAATPTPTPTATPPSNLASTTDLVTYIAIAVIVLIIAIAIVGALILRKHA